MYKPVALDVRFSELSVSADKITGQIGAVPPVAGPGVAVEGQPVQQPAGVWLIVLLAMGMVLVLLIGLVVAVFLLIRRQSA
jgi:hypothetical protein